MSLEAVKVLEAAVERLQAAVQLEALAADHVIKAVATAVLTKEEADRSANAAVVAVDRVAEAYAMVAEASGVGTGSASAAQALALVSDARTALEAALGRLHECRESAARISSVGTLVNGSFNESRRAIANAKEVLTNWTKAIRAASSGNG